LKAIDDGHCSGFVIRLRVENLSGGQVVPTSADLFSEVADLLDASLIERDGQRQNFLGKVRECYRLTDLGRQALRRTHRR
jgi:DNA-binding PadR family transcriptional regulator